MALAHPPDTRAALVALLDWYVESGVDLALDDEPHDRYAESLAPPPPPQIVETPPPSPVAPRPAPPGLAPPAARPRPPADAAPEEAARAAQALADSAQTIEELAAALATFPEAPFRDMARHFLFSAGTLGAPLMVMDGAPGEAEESSGEAFSGPQARLLDNMLKAIGRGRETAYLSYLSPWRPPGTSITPQKRAILAPFARRHVELAKPRVLLLFGDAPAYALLETNETVSKLRGKAFTARCGSHEARAFVFNSLDSILTSWALKPAAWRDLRAAAAALSN